MENLENFIEALVFAAGKAIKRDEILEKMPIDVSKKDLNTAISKLEEKYSGDSGLLFLTFQNKVQFSSNTKYGDLVAEILTPIKERELSKTLLEVLSIIAYKQPITRTEIEEIRGTNSEYAISTLARVNLIEGIGRKDTVGRPTLYATSEEFLKKFQLHDLQDLPDYNEVLAKLKLISGFNELTDELYRHREILVDKETLPSSEAASDIIDDFMDTEIMPDFLEGEDFEVIG